MRNSSNTIAFKTDGRGLMLANPPKSKDVIKVALAVPRVLPSVGFTHRLKVLPAPATKLIFTTSKVEVFRASVAVE